MSKYNLMKNEIHQYMYIDESKEKLNQFYTQEYYQVHKDAFLHSRGMQEGVAKAEPMKEINELEWLIDSEYSKVNEVAKHHLQGLEQTMLDVGCGAGNLMRYMRECGWNVKGVEPSKVYHEETDKDGLNIYHGMLDEFCKVNTNKFSLITLNHVVEHVSCPEEILDQCKKLLNENGMIYIKVPNDFNGLQLIANELVNKKQWWIAPPDHLSYFNRKSLRDLLEFLGFEIIHEGIDFPIELFVLMGINYIDQGELGKECHKMRKSMEMNLGKSQRELLYSKFMDMGWGRNILMIAKLK